MGMTLNPLAFARTAEDGSALELRALARGRSFRREAIRPDTDPGLHALIGDWLARGGRAEPVEGLSLAETMRLMAVGLLLDEGEVRGLPEGAAARIDDGSHAARALCPEIAPLLDAGIAAPPLPEVPDPAFAALGYLPLGNLVREDALVRLRGWYARLCDGGWLRRDTGEIERLIAHNDPVARRVLEWLCPWLSAVTGIALAPSYAFFAEYRHGADLPRHTDRDQCEVTVSLFIEYLPGDGTGWPGDAPCPWPLVIHAPGGDIALNQPPGGGPVFRGRALDHSRPALPVNDRARMLFLHYVAADFAGSRD